MLYLGYMCSISFLKEYCIFKIWDFWKSIKNRIAETCEFLYCQPEVPEVTRIRYICGKKKASSQYTKNLCYIGSMFFSST